MMLSWIDDNAIVGYENDMLDLKIDLMNQFECDDCGKMDGYVGGRIGHLQSLLKSGMLISHWRQSTFLRHISFLSCSFITSMIFFVVCTHAQFY